MRRRRVQTNDRRDASEETIDVIVTREEQEATSVEVYTTTPLISMMIRTAGSKRQQSQRLPHCRFECCEDDDLVKKVGVDGKIRGRGSNGLRRLGRWVV